MSSKSVPPERMSNSSRRRMMAPLSSSKNSNEAKKWSWIGGHRQRMRNLLDTGFLSDTTVFVGPDKAPFRVHRLILEAGSSVFHQQFKDGTKNELTVTDVDSNVFMLFLRHLYVGDNASDSYFDETEAMELLKLGSEYQVQDLTDICANILKKKLSDENVVDIFQKSMECGHTVLIESSLSYFCRNGWNIVESTTFANLRQECLYEVLKRDDLMVRSELQLYNALWRWGEAECTRQKIEPGDGENMRKVLQKLLGLIRFPVMEQAEFTLNVALKNVLSLEELVSILLYFTVSIEQRSAIPPGRFNSTPRSYYKDEGLKEGPINSNKSSASVSIPNANQFLRTVHRYDVKSTVKSKWAFVEQKREVLGFQVDTGISLHGFKCRLSRDPNRVCHFKDDWKSVIVNYCIKETATDRLVVSGAKGVDSNTWEVRFDTTAKIRERLGYSLTVEFGGHVKAQSKNTGEFRDMAVDEFLLEAGYGYHSNSRVRFFNDPYNSAIDESMCLFEFSRGKGCGLAISQGFIDEILFTV